MLTEFGDLRPMTLDKLKKLLEEDTAPEQEKLDWSPNEPGAVERIAKIFERTQGRTLPVFEGNLSSTLAALYLASATDPVVHEQRVLKPLQQVALEEFSRRTGLTGYNGDWKERLAGMAAFWARELSQVKQGWVGQESQAPPRKEQASLLPIHPDLWMAAAFVYDQVRALEPRLPTLMEISELQDLVVLSTVLKESQDPNIVSVAGNLQVSVKEAALYALAKMHEGSRVSLKKVRQYESTVKERMSFAESVKKQGAVFPNWAELYRKMTDQIVSSVRKQLKIALPAQPVENVKAYKRFKEQTLWSLEEECWTFSHGNPREGDPVVTIRAEGPLHYRNGTTVEDLPLGTKGHLEQGKEGLEFVVDQTGLREQLDLLELVKIQRKRGARFKVEGRTIRGWTWAHGEELREGDHAVTLKALGGREYSEGTSTRVLPIGSIGAFAEERVEIGETRYELSLKEIRTVKKRKRPDKIEEPIKVGDEVVIRRSAETYRLTPNGSTGIVKSIGDYVEIEFNAIPGRDLPAPETHRHIEKIHVYRKSVSPLQEALLRGDHVFRVGQEVRLRRGNTASSNIKEGVVVTVSPIKGDALPYIVHFEDGSRNRYGNQDLEFIEIPREWQDPADVQEHMASLRREYREGITATWTAIKGIIRPLEEEVKGYEARRSKAVRETTRTLKGLGISDPVVAFITREYFGHENEPTLFELLRKAGSMDYSSLAQDLVAKVREKWQIALDVSAIPQRDTYESLKAKLPQYLVSNGFILTGERPIHGRYAVVEQEEKDLQKGKIVQIRQVYEGSVDITSLRGNLNVPISLISMVKRVQSADLPRSIDRDSEGLVREFDAEVEVRKKARLGIAQKGVYELQTLGFSAAEVQGFFGKYIPSRQDLIENGIISY